jgi:hypothetical protein
MKRLKWILAVCLILGLGVVFIVGKGKVYKGQDKEVRESISLSHEIPPPSDTEPPQSYKEPEEGSIIVRVIGEDTGEGVGNAILSLFVLETGEKRGKIKGPFYRFIRTDDNGYYTFDPVPPGEYRIFYGEGKDRSHYVETKDSVDYVDVVMPEEGGEIRAPDIVLEVGGKVRVRVLKADGKTLMEEDKVAGILIYAPYKGKLWYGSTPGMVKAIKEKDGTYLIDGVPETDSAELQARVYGYGHVKKKGIKVKAGKITEVIDIIINTDDPTGIAGVVTSAEDGKPIEGATVIVYDLSIKKPNRDVGSAIIDENGKYTIRGLRPGVYDIFAMEANYDSIRKKSKNIKDKEEVKIDFVLSQHAEGKNQTKVEDPTPVNINCDSDLFEDVIVPDFNEAMIRFQEPDCLDSVWNNLHA